MQILGLLGMYFDTVVVFVINSSLLFRFAVAILCLNERNLPGVTDLLTSLNLTDVE